MTKSTGPSVTGDCERSPDGTCFFGYIDVDENRISCRLVPQNDPCILKLERFDICPPITTGKVFTFTGQE